MKFHEVKALEYFTYDNELCIKLPNPYSHFYNAVNLTANKTLKFNCNDEIEKVTELLSVSWK